MTREFHKEILELKNQVLDMGNLALGMLDDAVTALFSQDEELAHSVVKKKHTIREYDSNIEAQTLKLIALYQPMAIDLRRLATILKVITYLTRLGRYGKDIAAVMRDVDDFKCPKKLINLRHIWEQVREMIKDVLKAFDDADITLLKDLEERDDEVDELRWSVVGGCGPAA